MTDIEKLLELLSEAERSLRVKNVSDTEEKRKFVAGYLASKNVIVQVEAEWETFVEIKDNTVCGDGVKIQHKRCSNCHKTMGITEKRFCDECGAKMKKTGGKI